MILSRIGWLTMSVDSRTSPSMLASATARGMRLRHPLTDSSTPALTRRHAHLANVLA